MSRGVTAGKSTSENDVKIDVVKHTLEANMERACPLPGEHRAGRRYSPCRLGHRASHLPHGSQGGGEHRIVHDPAGGVGGITTTAVPE